MPDGLSPEDPRPEPLPNELRRAGRLTCPAPDQFPEKVALPGPCSNSDSIPRRASFVSSTRYEFVALDLQARFEGFV